MKTLILVLLLCTTVVSAQYTNRAVNTPVDSTYSLRMDERTIVNILTTYSLLHIYMDRFYTTDSTYLGIMGYTNAGKSQVLINDKYNENAKRLTILHEFYHVVFWQHGLFPPDEVVDSLAYEKFKQLYGQ